MTPIIILAAMASLLGLSYYADPSMPAYFARDITFVNFSYSFLRFTFSATILAGVEIHNDNVVGADLYKTYVDLYFPDLWGDLQNIGHLVDTQSSPTSSPTSQQHDHDHDRGMCIEKTSNNNQNTSTTTTPNNNNNVPFFSIQSRAISTSEEGAITIYLQNIAPKTYINVIRHLLLSGSIDILVSGVAHVKSPLGIPMSLGLVCDNTIDLWKSPLQLEGKSCLVEKISTGWNGLWDLVVEVRERVMKHYVEKDGDIFDRKKQKNQQQQQKDTNHLKALFSSSEVILDWHDF